MKGVRLAREAEIELFEASVWYESQQDGLGFEFESEIAEVLADVSEAPARFPALKRGLRRLADFPMGSISQRSREKSP